MNNSLCLRVSARIILCGLCGLCEMPPLRLRVFARDTNGSQQTPVNKYQTHVPKPGTFLRHLCIRTT